MDSLTESVLVAIRKIIHASDLHSRQIKRHTGRTAPQLLLLKAINDHPGAPVGLLAGQISLSQATTTMVLDRLEKEGLAVRRRCETDRRKVLVDITENGLEQLACAPSPLQSRFIEEFEKLRIYEQTAMLAALQHVAELMLSPACDRTGESDVLYSEGKTPPFTGHERDSSPDSRSTQ